VNREQRIVNAEFTEKEERTGNVIHTSRSTIYKHQGAHRTARLEGLEEPVNYGMHGGILAFYNSKYGVEVEKEYPATLDHFVASVAG
jgi:hypothetical protein